MAQSLDFETFARMLRCAAGAIRAREEELSRLDSHGGDGDHGTTMVRAMERLEGALEASSTPSLDVLLRDIGWAIMGADGGATGPLLGSFFMAMAPAAGDDTLDGEALAALFEAGLAGVRKRTRAQVGDKTLIDALVPAVQSLRAALDEGAAIPVALERAAAAAERGARSTRDLQARFGRAKNLGERSKGHQDPGATSIALIFQGFHQGARTDG